jgi:hypothetical protein
MAATFIDVIQVKNVSTQIVPFFVQRKTDSQITTVYGEIKLQPEAVFEAEDNRFDLTQLTNLQKKNLINFTRLSRRIDLEETGTEATA